MDDTQNLSPKELLALMEDPIPSGSVVVPEKIEVPEGTPYLKVKKEVRPQMVAKGIHQQYDIIRVNHPLSYWYKKPEEFTYTRLEDIKLQDWARDALLQAFGVFDVVTLKNSVEMVKALTEKDLDKLDRNWVEIAKGEVYWSREDGQLHEKPSGPCFWRLFDTPVPDKHIVTVPAFDKEQTRKLMESYQQTLDALEDKTAFKQEPYDFIRIWAKGNHDVYLDIVRSIAYCFVKKKPVGSYILVGLRRNGKSSFVGLLRTIFGKANTTGVRLSQLGDAHYTMGLSRTLLNAPDEEDEKAIDAQASFKTLSDHGSLSLMRMYSQEPEDVQCDFMSFFPMNHIPEWTGSGASACMKRTLVIPFYADLSQYDKSNFNFAETTFTADFMCEFMGYIFAFANYYTYHELEFSPTMRAAQESIEEELDSAVLYREKFEKYFDGFSTLRLIFEDYCNWCKTLDMVIRPRKEFKFVFREYLSSRTNFTQKGSPYTYKVYRIPQAGHQPVFEEMPKTAVGDINWLHESGASLVERMDAYYEMKKEAFNGSSR